MERNPTLTFMTGVPPAEAPITDLTINDIRLVCVAGTYDGSVIYPDNVENPQFAHLGNGQYAIGYFNHANFKSEIGSGYSYYVKVQRKIGGDWTDQYQFGVFWIGDISEVIDYLIGIETTARTNADALLMPKTGGTFSGAIALSEIQNSGLQMSIGGNSGKVFLGNNQYGTPLFVGSPLYGSSGVTKSWTTNEITNRLASIISDGNYQESLNIVRVIPEGVAVTGQIYVNLSTALVYGKDTLIATAIKPLTVSIAGVNNDTGGVNLDFVEYDAVNHYYACAFDYIHFKGAVSNAKILSDGNISTPGNQFKAGALGRIIMEDLYFYFDNDGQTGEIENIIFKNCKFESRGGTIDFLNCKFEGLNTFESTTPNEFSFTSCYGTVFGISELSSATPYETMTKKFNPKMISKEYNFSEPITRTAAGTGTFFLDSDNSNRLTYKDTDGGFTIIQSPLQLTFGGTHRGVSAENNSIFLDTDNSNALSFKNSVGDIYTINITGI